jgi:hypothetical protein
MQLVPQSRIIYYTCRHQSHPSSYPSIRINPPLHLHIIKPIPRPKPGQSESSENIIPLIYITAEHHRQAPCRLQVCTHLAARAGETATVLHQDSVQTISLSRNFQRDTGPGSQAFQGTNAYSPVALRMHHCQPTGPSSQLNCRNRFGFRYTGSA